MSWYADVAYCDVIVTCCRPKQSKMPKSSSLASQMSFPRHVPLLSISVYLSLFLSLSLSLSVCFSLSHSRSLSLSLCLSSSARAGPKHAKHVPVCEEDCTEANCSNYCWVWAWRLEGPPHPMKMFGAPHLCCCAGHRCRFSDLWRAVHRFPSKHMF